LNTFTALAITKLDVLTGFDRLLVATRYRGAEGAEFDDFPYHQTVLHHAAGDYVELAGWSEELGECRTESDLPPAAREYLQFMADFVGVPVVMVGVGPGRDDVIWMTTSSGSVADRLAATAT
jgi:adenylosuccinate synthase